MGHGPCTYQRTTIKIHEDGNTGRATYITTTTICDCPGFVQENFNSKTKRTCLWCGHDYNCHWSFKYIVSSNISTKQLEGFVTLQRIEHYELC